MHLILLRPLLGRCTNVWLDIWEDQDQPDVPSAIRDFSKKSAGGLEALLDSSLSVHANLLREDNKANEREEKDFEMDHFLENTCLGGAHVIPSV